MANWSQSHFLQSLGWATLNSFWQMAVLWCLYLAACYLFKLSSHKKYQLSVIAIITGFAWFLLSFFFFYQSSPISVLAIFNQTVTESNSLLNIFLISASVAYLSLLIFPSYRLIKNWQFVQKIKKEGLGKANLNYRLFVQKIAAHLGIGKKVLVFVSEIVKSPVTIGYIKPIILLPVAALNNLSTQQVEAVLLHELSHIKRYDYLVNFILSIIHTVLYFNPFVKQFMKSIEEEREHCCDQMVLQFGYDKVSYASALLALEKISAQTQVLAIAATGRNYLLHRIEKIVGMEKKKGFQIRQFAGVLAALFCIIALNSILIIRENKKPGNYSFAYSTVANPFALFSTEEEASSPVHSISPVPATGQHIAIAAKQNKNEKTTEISFIQTQPTEHLYKTEPDNSNHFLQVGADDVETSLTKEQKEQVVSTVNATKKVMEKLQWKEIENEIADAMTKTEKALAKQEFKKEVENMNWQNVEKNLKAKYEQLDWNKITVNLSNAKKLIELDSLQVNYNLILNHLEKAEKEIAKPKTSCNPIPDVSVAEITKAKEDMKAKVEVIKALRSNKKVVRL